MEGASARGASEPCAGQGWRMTPISYRYCHFPPVIIQHAVWLYARFTLSFRDVEDLLAERGIEVSYETIRRWIARFGPKIGRRLWHHRSRAQAHGACSVCDRIRSADLGYRCPVQ